MPRSTANNTVRNFVRYANLRLLLLCILMSTFGCMLVYSASQAAGYGISGAATQIGASLVGIILAMFISLVDYETVCNYWPIWAGLSILLVILTFTPLGLNVAGTDDTAWLGIRIGSFSLTFQPSELMKITFIITFAYHLSKAQQDIHRFKTVILLCLHAAIPIGLTLLQGDDGTALVFIAIFLTMMVVTNINLLYYLAGLIGVCGAFPLLWTYFLDDTKKARLLCILPPYIEKYLTSEGWQQYEGLRAIGSGKLSGIGYMNGQDFYARNNDFIFSVCGQEFGFIGSLILLALLALLLFELYRSATKSRDSLGTYICIGMMALIGFQSLINIGMNLRILPVIGITLPFYSSGGSSAGTLYLGIGLVMSVSYSQNVRKGNSLFKN